MEWTGVNTPHTVMTTRAPAVLKSGLKIKGSVSNNLVVSIIKVRLPLNVAQFEYKLNNFSG